MSTKVSLIGIDSHIYDIKNFMDKYPDKEFFGIKLHDLIGKNYLTSVEKCHNVDFTILESVKKIGIDDDNNIEYVCRYYFNKTIPKHFFGKYLKENTMDDNMYYMIPNPDKRGSELIVIYKISGVIYNTILQLIGRRWEYRKLNAEQFFTDVEGFMEYFEKIGMKPYHATTK